MRFNLYRDVKDFYKDVRDVLMRHEAQNLIPLGNIMIGVDGGDKTEWRDPAHWLMAAVTDDAGVRLTAVMTRGHNLTLYATDNIIDGAALTCLINGIDETDFSIGGVMTEKSLAERFARMYAAVKGIKYEIYKNQRIYELSRVNPGIIPIGGLRLARESDISFLPYWIEGFNGDCFGSSELRSDAEHYRYYITKNNLYILEDGGTPVSMARIGRIMQTACGVNLVYTPPYFRSRGYASSCVAALSRLILERGFFKCVLYADLANPVSNSIYQKIGYTPVCDSLDIGFIYGGYSEST